MRRVSTAVLLACVALATTATAASAKTTDPYRAQQVSLTTGRVDAAAALAASKPRVTVAVLDSGIQADHPDLAGRIVPGYDVLTSTAGVPTDTWGHGTEVAGVLGAVTGNNVGIAGVAPVDIMPVKVVSSSVQVKAADLATGIRWAADHGANIITISVATVETNAAAVLQPAVDYAASKNVPVVAAAGDFASLGSPSIYPAHLSGVIGVGSVAANLAPSTTSSQNADVDVVAPGEGIGATGLKSTYTIVNGTSFAAPYVAGVLALGDELAKTPPSAATLSSDLTASAVDLGAPGKDVATGYGFASATGLVNALTPGTIKTTAPAAPKWKSTTATYGTATSHSTTFTQPAGSVVEVDQRSWTNGTWTASTSRTTDTQSTATLAPGVTVCQRLRSVTMDGATSAWSAFRCDTEQSASSVTVAVKGSATLLTIPAGTATVKFIAPSGGTYTVNGKHVSLGQKSSSKGYYAYTLGSPVAGGVFAVANNTKAAQTITAVTAVPVVPKS